MPRWVRSDDPIPEGQIRLSEAFEQFYRAVTPNWRELDEAEVAAYDATGGPSVGSSERALDAERVFSGAINTRAVARGDADRQFRAAISAGELRPMIRDPDTGVVLELSPTGWDRPSGCFPSGFDEDFVETDDMFQPGPPAYIGGLLRPIFFDSKKFAGWLSVATIRAEGDKNEHLVSRCRRQLEDWKADRKRLTAEITKWTERPISRPSKLLIAEALSAWHAKTFGYTLASGTIENRLRDELTPATELL